MAAVDIDSTCVKCGAPIVWAVSTGDKRIPLDPGLHDDGTVVLVDVDGGPRARTLTGVELPALSPAHRDHRRTCPKGTHAARIAYATAPKCPACVQRGEPDPRMDPWLVEHGYRAHIGCLDTPVPRPAPIPSSPEQQELTA